VRYWRKAWRDVRAMRARAILLVLVIGVGIGTAAGIALALHDVQATRDAFYRGYALPDLDARLTGPVSASALLARAQAAGATRAAVRLILDGTARLPSGDQPAAELVGMSPAAPLDRLALLHGRPLAAGDPTGAVLEADFATSSHLRVGDQLNVDVAGRPLTLRVRGLARSPEYLLATANPEYLIPQPGSLAVVFLPLGGLQQLTGLAGRADDLAVDFPGGPSAARGNRMVNGLTLAAVTPRSQQYSYRFTNADIRSFSLFAPVLGAVFGVVGFLLLVLSLRRLIHAQRRELGALLAIGYPRRAVVLAAVLPAVMLGAGGALAAAAAASGVAYLVGTEYAAAVGFPRVVHTQAPAFLLVAAGSALAATLLAALVPAASLASLRPSEALRGEALAAFDVPPWLQEATSHGGPPFVYALRTLLRRLLPTVATCVSLAAAIGLGAALGILTTSVNSAVDASFAQQGWSYTADLVRPIPVTAAAALATRAGAPAAEPVTEGPAQLAAAGHSASSQLVGIPAGTSLDHLAIVAGAPPAQGRLVVSEQLASQLRVHTGDRVTITTPTARQNLTVGGIARTLAGQQAFLPAAQAGPLLGLAGQATSLYVAGGPDVASRLLADPEVTHVVSKAAALDGTHKLVSELSGLIDVMLAISLGVGALFLVSSLAMSFLDREGEFATLRALGYGRRQVGGIVATESLSQTIVAAALSVPCAILIAWPIARRIGAAWFQISVTPVPGNFILAISIAIVLAVLAILYAVRQIMRANIAATVRARLIG
jgi:putative ABC transport system permease protein